jgi:probable rRNA maturation factor
MAAAEGSAMAIELANESGLSIDEAALIALARHVLAEMGVHPLAELSMLLVDEPAMTALHERWMDSPGPTDVLAFPMDELDPTFRTGRGTDDDADPAPTLLGDVVLCPEVARRQARTAGHPAEDELHLLATHGILHLLGYDHGEPAQEQAMFRRQRELLTSWRQARAPGAERRPDTVPAVPPSAEQDGRQ